MVHISKLAVGSLNLLGVRLKGNQIMKGTKLAVLFTAMSLLGVAQKSTIQLNELVKGIQTSAREYQSENNDLSIKVNELHFSHLISNYKIIKEDQKNFAILQDGNANSKFHLTCLNGTIQGIALDYENEKGYKIVNGKGDDLVSFVEVPSSNLFFECDKPLPSATNNKSKKKTRKHIGNSGTQPDVLLLESRPNAQYLIYLDYDGEDSLPGWEYKNYNAANPNISDAVKRESWESVAEDFAPFGVNVTTNRALFDAHPELYKSYVAIAQFGNVGWGGLAHLSSFGTGEPVLVDYDYSNNNFYLMSISHELGHALGLNHDGESLPYYGGHGEYSPIMGNGSNFVSQWSKGEYSGATNYEDDINIIGSILTFSPDAHQNNTVIIVSNDSVSPDLNNGIMENRADVDTFQINVTEAGDIVLTIGSPVAPNGNLDIRATLLDNSGNVLQVSNPIGDRNGYIDYEVTPGTYYLVIEGVGELSVNDGFSDYGSLGYYQISGHIGYLSPRSIFSASTNSICLGDNITFTNASFGSDLNYEWTIEGGNITSSTDENITITFNTPGELEVSLKSSNLNGNSHSNYKVHVGNADIRLLFPTEKLNPDISGSIKLTNEVSSFTYDDLSNVNGDTAYFDVCIFSECYEVSLQDLYTPETCGAELWTGKAYQGGATVYYNGALYTNSWYAEPHNLPSDGTPWVKQSDCSTSDTDNKVVIKSLTTNATLFETNPQEVGASLSITDNFCENITSITEQDFTFKIYPNPAQDFIVLENGNQLQTTYSIININGQIVHHSILNDNRINISFLKAGAYFLELNTENGNYSTQKFIKTL